MSYEHLDVLIVGAGLSGIGAAARLQRELPHKSYAILETRDAVGGTWDLFRYPGVRSDSDMYTLGYDAKPWQHEKAIADGWTIREYIREAAAENGIDKHIRFGHKLIRADWDTPTARWLLEIELVNTGDRLKMTAGFLHFCSGYYKYDEGYTPDFPGIDDFQGTLVHPQFWPEDLDYEGKRVVIIGSGATAMTLVPAMAEKAAHVTMLQRSPTYVLSRPAIDGLAQAMDRVMPDAVAYGLTRLRQLLLTEISYGLMTRYPKQARALIRKLTASQLGKNFDVDTHFKPRYNPWEERLCLVPDGDLFKSLRAGTSSIVTDHIKAFTENGIELESGVTLEADIIVTATGLVLQGLGGAVGSIDGEEMNFADAITYRGLMFAGVPNLATTFGYTNASWTLKADLISAYVCRLLKHMDRNGYDYAVPEHPPANEPLKPFLVSLQSGYVKRGKDLLPQQGVSEPWVVHQNYWVDMKNMRLGPVDVSMKFGSATAQVSESNELAAV